MPATADIGSVRIYHFDANHNRWVPLATVVDADAGTATATIERTGSYAVGVRQAPPVIVDRYPPPGGALRRNEPVRVVLDDPSGLDADGTQLTIDGVDTGARLDPFPGVIAASFSPNTIPGRHVVGLVARYLR